MGYVDYSDHKKIVKDSEDKIKSENSEVKNEELNDLKTPEQTTTTVDELSNADVTDTNENISKKEV